MSNSLFWVKEFILRKRHEEKGTIIELLLCVRHKMQGVFTDVFFVSPEGGHHHTSLPVPAAVSDVGAAGLGDRISHGCWREAGCGCLWAVHGSLPGSGLVASWRWCCFRCLCDKD